jgi:hypothetical protein
MISFSICAAMSGSEARVQVDGHVGILCGKFFGGVFCGFCWGFWEKRVLRVVFLWCRCGGLRGKDGLWVDGFLRRGFFAGFGIYFWGEEGGSRVARMPTHVMKPHEWGTRLYQYALVTLRAIQGSFDSALRAVAQDDDEKQTTTTATAGPSTAPLANAREVSLRMTLRC